MPTMPKRLLAVFAALLLPAQALALSIDVQLISESKVDKTARFGIYVDNDELLLEALFVSLSTDSSQLSFVSGYGLASLFLNPATGASLDKIGNPFLLGSDPPGAIRALSYNRYPTLRGLDLATGRALAAILDFDVVGSGPTTLDLLFQGGDIMSVYDPAISDVRVWPPGALTGSSTLITPPTLTSLVYTPAPEPGTALLLGLGLVLVRPFRRATHRG